MPTILIDVARDMKVLCEEIFAPVDVGHSVRHAGRGRSPRSTRPSSAWPPASSRATSPPRLTAARRIHVGVVHINESSSSRVDLMPFTGVKDSGIGREGPKYAMQEMTEERLITISV